MINIQQAYQQLVSSLTEIYDMREAANITNMVIEHVTGFRKIDRVLDKQFLLSEEHNAKLKSCLVDLLEYKPVQYILHEAWFAGMKFYVDENVLIPRPETEEMVEEISSFGFQVSSLLDIGTGSGCIAIALKKKSAISNLQLSISAIDISKSALNIAEQNAIENNAEIDFFQANILDENEWKQFPKFDIVVSNPPYIKRAEKTSMRENVLNFEPHLALFVDDEDSLIFYKKIAAFGLQHLNKHGKLFFEINENSGKDICELLENFGYKNIKLKKDLQGKDRMVSANLIG
jgi:release factor glutamine methyltransferase